MQQAKAYILIEAEAGQVSTIIDTLRGMDGIEAADPVTGPYDIVVVIETSDQRDIGRLVMHDIHGIGGIKRTITCLAI